MKRREFSFDGSNNARLPKEQAVPGGQPNRGPAGSGIRRAHCGHIRPRSRTKLAFQCALMLLLWPALALQAATTVTHMAAGGYYEFGYSLFVKSDGSLWGMGANFFGQLGDGTFNSTNKPEEIVSDNVVALAAGDDYSLFVKSDGSLWGMGVGYGNTPEEIVSNDVVAVAAGGGFRLLLKSDGSLWGMGDNDSGQLGDGTFNSTDKPEEIVSNNVVAMAAGGAFSLFLKSDGSLWGMGDNAYGQLGDGTYSTNYPYGTNQPEEIVSKNVVAVAAGPSQSLFVKSDGSLWGMGANNAGQLGDGFNEPSSLSPERIVPLPQPVLAAPELVATGALTTVTNIAAGDGYSFLIKSDGSLWAVGNNSSGQLGDGSFDTAYAPVQIVSSNVVAAATGEYYWSNDFGSLPPRQGLFSLFLKSDGSLWAMGDNYYGQLGDGTFNSTDKPEEIVSDNVVALAAGDDYSLFVKSDGSLWGMGDNSSTGSVDGIGDYSDGQLGDATTNEFINPPQEIVSNGVAAVAAGGDFSWFWVLHSGGHSLFVRTDGSLWGMGYNFYGELGDGSFNNAYAPEEIVSNGVVAVAAGRYHSLFVKSDGSLWGMGDNAYGQLGDGTYSTNYPYGTNQPEEIVSNNVVAVAAGPYHSLFIKSDGSLWGMGDNEDGQLGDGTTNDIINTPEEIVSNHVVAVAAGPSQSLFIKSDGSSWGMGDNSGGELGNGSGSSLVPEKVAGGPWLRGTCFAGGTYRLLSSTNAALPLSQWTPVWTNTIVHRGPNNFSAPLPDDLLSRDPQRFYILRSR